MVTESTPTPAIPASAADEGIVVLDYPNLMDYYGVPCEESQALYQDLHEYTRRREKQLREKGNG